MDLLGKNKEIYGYKTLFREIGYYISRLEQYERSLNWFDRAIQKTPNNRRALLGRAWARSKACYYEGALEDIRTALGLDPDDLVMLAHKALNTYLNCEFEDGLVQNTRLKPVRKKPDNFVLGAMHCADAIENCLSRRAGRPLRDHYKIIRVLAWKKNFDAQRTGWEPKARPKKKKKKEDETHMLRNKLMVMDKKKMGMKSSANLKSKSNVHTLSMLGSDSILDEEIRDSIYSVASEVGVTPPPISFPFRPLQNYTSNIENYMAEKYLDCLYLDKIYLRALVNKPEIMCPNEKGTKKIIQLAKQGYKTVSYKQELLRTRRPFYLIKFQEATVSGQLKIRQEQELKKIQEAARKEAVNIMNKMKEALGDKKLKTLLDLADKLRNHCDLKSKKILPDRDQYMSFLFESVCQAHYDVKRLNKNQYAWDQEKRIHKLLGLQVSREPSADSVIAEFKDIFVDWKKQSNIYGERLKKAESPEELAWLYHELSRFHLEMKQFDVSKVYARKCMTEARLFEGEPNLKWVANAMMLLLKINILQHNKNDARSDAQEAWLVAKQIGDPNLKEFFEKVINVVDNVEFDDIHGPKVLQKREQKIVEMMSEGKMKDEAAHLFRMISAMPASRRMSVMPGIRLQDDENNPMAAMAAKRMSIMPGAKKQDDFAATAKIKQKQRTTAEKGGDDGSASGIGFMEMIQYHID